MVEEEFTPTEKRGSLVKTYNGTERVDRSAKRDSESECTVD